jgi:glutamine---fructose-6-phosphate transaminase (isomerizing)
MQTTHIPCSSHRTMNAVDPSATRMFLEAQEAADCVRTQLIRNHTMIHSLGAALRQLSPRAVVTCARGSSDHAATYARYLIETRLGLLTSSISPSISSVYGVQQKLQQCLFLAISQSGRSPDLLAAAAAAKHSGATVVALVNAEDSPLAHAADHVIPLHAGPETSVAATKSFIASLSAIAHLLGAWSTDQALLGALTQIPELLHRAWHLDWTPLIDVLNTSDNLLVIGRGVGLGIAQEAALKLKETCSLHAEAFSGAEVQHGPMALFNRAIPALILTQDDATRNGLEALANELSQSGVKVLITDHAGGGGVSLPALHSHAALTPILHAQSFYRVANAVAVARGLNPDQPPRLNKVTETL